MLGYKLVKTCYCVESRALLGTFPFLWQGGSLNYDAVTSRLETDFRPSKYLKEMWTWSTYVSTKHGLLGIYLLKLEVKRCLLCLDHISALKAYSLSWYYSTKLAENYNNLTDAEMAWIAEALMAYELDGLIAYRIF